MATVTINMKPDGDYDLVPPRVNLTRSDQKITWNLAGPNWDWVLPGIVCEKSPTDPKQSPWPARATGPDLIPHTNQYGASANAPNSGATVIYKWTFTVRNASTKQVVHVDPEIWNEPKP